MYTSLGFIFDILNRYVWTVVVGEGGVLLVICTRPFGWTFEMKLVDWFWLLYFDCMSIWVVIVQISIDIYEMFGFAFAFIDCLVIDCLTSGYFCWSMVISSI